eukprot:4631927-Amphidinium_carterae.1
MQTLNIHKMDKGIIGMMQKMNINLPSPTQFDGRYPHFNEWGWRSESLPWRPQYVNIEDIMDECTKSVTVIQLNDIQGKYTADEVKRLHITYSNALTDGQDGYEEFMDMTVNIKKMRGDIVNFSQTLNYVLPHATKPGSEAHSITTRMMRQSNGFEFWRQPQLHFA